MVKSSAAKNARRTWKHLVKVALMVTGAEDVVAVVVAVVAEALDIAVAELLGVAVVPSSVPSLPLSWRTWHRQLIA